MVNFLLNFRGHRGCVEGCEQRLSTAECDRDHSVLNGFSTGAPGVSPEGAQSNTSYYS